MSLISQLPLSQGQQQELIALLQRMIQAPGGSGEEGGCARVVAEQMQAMGYHYVHVDEYGNVVGMIRGSGSGSVLFDAHMDTVPADPAQWTHPPFAGTVVGDRIYGRGTSDMRGALAAAIYAVGLLARDPGDAGTIWVCGSVIEETAEGHGLLPVLRRFNPAHVVIMEATALRVNHGQRGRGELVIETQGRPAHSANPQVGVNAVVHMARAIEALRLDGRPLGADPLLGEAIMVVTDIHSEPYPGLSVVPTRCRITVDRRLLVEDTVHSVGAEVQAALDALAAGDPAFRGTVQVATGNQGTYTGRQIPHQKWAPAWKTPAEHPLVSTAVAALRAIGQSPELGTYSFCTNGSGSAGTLGIPTIGYGPSYEYLAHISDEYLELDQLFKVTEGYGALARALSRI